MTVSVWAPYCAATLNGDAIDTSLVRGARVEASFGDPVSRGYVKCLGAPSWSQGDQVTIALGGGVNNITRLVSGTVLQGDYLNSGPTFELVCRGPLYALQKYRNNRPNGITLAEMTGGPAPDEEIARAVLDICGVSYISGNISGTGITRGALAAVAYTWRKGETGLDYLGRLSKASLGYQIVETIGGDIIGDEVFRVPITATISGSPDFTLTDADIFEGAHTQISTFERFTAWQVTGFDFGDGNGAVNFSYPDPIPDGTIPYAYSSEMIERALDSDPGGGISAETVLGYVRDETDGPITKLSGLQTPRDDHYGPGQIIHVTSDWLGVDRDFVLVGVTVETDEQWFLQTLELIGA